MATCCARSLAGNNAKLRSKQVISPVSVSYTHLDVYKRQFLHWPDSMFTWDETEHTLFSCDFYGAHYCEPYVLDLSLIHI